MEKYNIKVDNHQKRMIYSCNYNIRPQVTYVPNI